MSSVPPQHCSRGALPLVPLGAHNALHCEGYESGGYDKGSSSIYTVLLQMVCMKCCLRQFGAALVHNGGAEISFDPELLRQLEVLTPRLPLIIKSPWLPFKIGSDPMALCLLEWLPPSFPVPALLLGQVGMGGSNFLKFEEYLGLPIGVHDSTEGEGAILMLGPSMQFESVLFNIHGLAQCASSSLTNLLRLACDALHRDPPLGWESPFMNEEEGPCLCWFQSSLLGQVDLLFGCLEGVG